MTSPAEHSTPEPSIEELIGKLQPKLRRILARYRVPVEDAEDLLQQSFLDLVFKRATIYNPEAWLLATVRNRSIIYWRRRRSQICDAVDISILEMVAKPEVPSQRGAMLRHDLERVLEQLPERCRDLLKLRYGLGYKPAEVAATLGYQPSSIRKVTSRCLTRLTRQLAEVGFCEKE
ncbi:MAG: sigma-70 family RNA polymerase sigma factor [Acidobacteriota bacterium]